MKAEYLLDHANTIGSYFWIDMREDDDVQKVVTHGNFKTSLVCNSGQGEINRRYFAIRTIKESLDTDFCECYVILGAFQICDDPDFDVFVVFECVNPVGVPVGQSNS